MEDGEDVFAYSARSGSSESSGQISIMDFNAADDKLNLSSFNKDSAVLTLTDLLANAEEGTVNQDSGVIISFTGWAIGGDTAGSGSIFL